MRGEYHVWSGIAGIYVGKNGGEKALVTEEAIDAVLEWMLPKDDETVNFVTARDGKGRKIRLSVEVVKE